MQGNFFFLVVIMRMQSESGYQLKSWEFYNFLSHPELPADIDLSIAHKNNFFWCILMMVTK